MDKDEVIEWFDKFTDYIAMVDINLYEEACDYADTKENNNGEQ